MQLLEITKQINPRLSSFRCCAKTDEEPNEWIYPSCEQLPKKSVLHEKNSLDCDQAIFLQQGIP